MTHNTPMATYNIDDRHCPEGHSWVFVNNTIVFDDYYYCEECDKIFRPSIVGLPDEYFNGRRADLKDDLKNMARFKQAQKKVTVNDLKKLGYL